MKSERQSLQNLFDALKAADDYISVVQDDLWATANSLRFVRLTLEVALSEYAKGENGVAVSP